MKYKLKEPKLERADGFDEYPELLRHLLLTRGVQNKKDADIFLNPDYEKHIHDPFLMKDMQKAVTLLSGLLEKKDKVVIYADYDADGIPGAVIMRDFLVKIGYENFEVYIPHRHDEGFGLNSGAVREFAKNGVKMIMTIDCGISDVSEVGVAKELGMKVIITDHHLPGSILPNADAILDPKQADCDYPEKNLCGCAVAFKFIEALISDGKFSVAKGWSKWLLDMVGIATLSDMVPLVGENRVLAFYGLKVLRKSPRLGLMKLLRKIKINQREMTEDDIVFSVTPKLNAASRMGEPIDAFRLLSTQDEIEADELSSILIKINDERKGIVGSLVKEVNKIVKERYGFKGKKIIVVGNPSWRPALLGLVANSLIKDHACPVFLWGRDGDDKIKGSCRSLGSVSVVALMQSAPDYFLD